MPQESVQESQALRVNAAVWFEIPVRDMQRAKAFYEAVLNVQLRMERMDEYEMAMFPGQSELSGAGGCLARGPMSEPSNKGTLVYFGVNAIEPILARVAPNGGKVIRDKMNIGEHGFIAIFEDCEGNTLGLHSMK
jgi:uncharacterized protein